MEVPATCTDRPKTRSDSALFRALGERLAMFGRVDSLEADLDGVAAVEDADGIAVEHGDAAAAHGLDGAATEKREGRTRGERSAKSVAA